MIQIIQKNWLFILFLAGIIIFTFWKLTQTFYQQDEWIAVGNAMTGGFKALIPRYSLFQILAGQGRVIATPINYIFYYYFPLNVLPFALFALIFHFLNSLLIFTLVYRLSNNSDLAKISSLFFGVAYVGSQAVIWPAATTTVLPAAFFSFLSLNFFTYFIQLKRKRYLYLSLISIIIGFLFKESCVFVFLLFPIMYVLFSERKFSLSEMVKLHLPFIVYLVLILGIRITSIQSSATSDAIYPSTAGTSSYKLVSRLIFYPLESLSQIFINGNLLYPMARTFVRDNYYRIWGNPGDGVVMETIAADMLSLFFSFLVIGVTFIIYKIEKNLSKITIFGIVFTLLSFIPYIFIDKPTAFIESRHFYMSVAGGGILVSLLLLTVRSLLMKRLRLSLLTSSWLVACVFFSLLVWQINYVHHDINVQVASAAERKKFLATLQELYPSIPKNPIFYITSDRDYYVPGNKVPFQQGFGYSLMIVYYKTGVIPKEMIASEYLWMLPIQGYQEIDGKGFGYFWDLEKVKNTVYEKKLDVDSIVAAKYSAATMLLTDITQDIRKEVAASVSALGE